MLGRFAPRSPQTQMIPDILQDMIRAEFAARRRKIAPEMTTEEAKQKIHRSIDHKEPRHEEVPIARDREVGAQDRPSRKSAAMRHSVGIIVDAKEAGRIDVVIADCRGAHGLAGFRIDVARNRKHGGHATIAVIAPIERGMKIEELKPAHQQQCEAQHIDPMRNAHGYAVAINDLPLSRNSLRHTGARLICCACIA